MQAKNYVTPQIGVLRLAIDEAIRTSNMNQYDVIGSDVDWDQTNIWRNSQ